MQDLPSKVHGDSNRFNSDLSYPGRFHSDTHEIRRGPRDGFPYIFVGKVRLPSHLAVPCVVMIQIEESHS